MYENITLTFKYELIIMCTISSLENNWLNISYLQCRPELFPIFGKNVFFSFHQTHTYDKKISWWKKYEKMCFMESIKALVFYQKGNWKKYLYKKLPILEVPLLLDQLIPLRLKYKELHQLFLSLEFCTYHKFWGITYIQYARI